MARNLVLVVLVLSMALWPAARADAGACAAPRAALSLLTPETDAVAPGLGLLVGAQMPGRTLGFSQGHRDPSLSATLEREGEASIALRTETIAPGLFRLVPESQPRAGAWTVRTSDAAFPVTFTAGAQPAPLAAPAISSVWRADPGPSVLDGVGSAPRGRGGYTPQPRMGVELARARPPGARALVLFAMRGEHAQPFVAAETSTRTRSLTVYAPSGGRCAPVTFGSPVPVGTTVRAAYVDTFGRLSELGDPLTVSAR